MPILNYTTTIAVEKTVGEIQQRLAKAKATAILCEYDPEGTVVGMSFRMSTGYGDFTYLIPARIDGVFRSLKNAARVPRQLQTRSQAARVAWRIIKDWIEAQLAIVEAELAGLPEVFLPYMQDERGATLYERIEKQQFRLAYNQPTE